MVLQCFSLFDQKPDAQRVSYLQELVLLSTGVYSLLLMLTTLYLITASKSHPHGEYLMIILR